jgi:septin family protein
MKFFTLFILLNFIGGNLKKKIVMTEEIKTYKILCIGKVGVGKSALCNLFYQKKRLEKETFLSQQSKYPITNKYQIEKVSYTFTDRKFNLEIIDSPAIGDVNNSDLSSHKEIIDSIKKNERDQCNPFFN